MPSTHPPASPPTDEKPENLAFIIATQAFLEAYQAGATVDECKRAVEWAGYRIVPIPNEEPTR